ncbi:MAG: pyridoxine 5'-phosphate synthase [Candidatus Aminicenantia bacterium]
MRLSVNVDHSATLRQARRALEPDPIRIALLAEMAGASGIIVHLRGDRRHIQERDLELLRKTVKTKLNLEMAATQEMIRIALNHKPDVSTLVPERVEELTTEGGLDVITHFEHLKTVVNQLKTGDIEVSIFVDPDEEQIKACHKLGVSTIEINTGKYADARGIQRTEELSKIERCAKFAKKLDLNVSAGHGLDYRNVIPIIIIQEIDELSIGFSIISRAMYVGIEKAVKEMLELIREYR